jgi:bifunctional non-homologous end joining protein LigD
MARGAATASLPQWIKPQLARLADRAPNGAGWLHEIKLDGYGCTRGSPEAERSF